jgi:asparagine synthase (glutamine-hydrolysing)
MRPVPAPSLLPSSDVDALIKLSRLDARIDIEGVTSFGTPAEGGGYWLWNGAELVARAGDSSSGILFLHNRPDGVTLSTSLSAIASVDSLCLDVLAWTTFQYVGYYLGEDTPFRNVHALAPGTLLTYDHRGLTRSSATPLYDQDSISQHAATERFVSLVRRSVERLGEVASGAELVVELSSGLDSRHVLYQLLSSGFRIAQAVTSRKYPPDDIDESPVAQEVATSAAVPSRVVLPPANRAAAELRAAVDQSVCSDEGAWYLFRLWSAAGSARRVWFSGIGGDILTGRMPVPAGVDGLLSRGDFAAVARLRVQQSRRARLLSLLSSRLGVEPVPVEDVVERIANELQVHRRAGDILAAYTFWNRARRKHLPAVTRLLTRGDTARMPYFDPEMVQYLLSVGPRIRYGPDFHASAVSGFPWRRVDTRVKNVPATRLHATQVHFAAYRTELTRCLNILTRGTQALPVDDGLLATGSSRLLGILLTNSLHVALLSTWTGRGHRLDDLRQVWSALEW